MALRFAVAMAAGRRDGGDLTDRAQIALKSHQEQGGGRQIILDMID